MGVTVFAPATAVEAVSGFPAWGSIIVISALATAYTTLGGLRGVIWTDVFQFAIMCSGLLAILIQVPHTFFSIFQTESSIMKEPLEGDKVSMLTHTNTGGRLK